MRSPEQIRPASVRGAAHSGDRGAALVITLIVCTVLAMVVVAMMQNTTLDRASSAGIANQYRAKLVAESGCAAAQSMLVNLLSTYPDSVTVWQNVGGGTVNGTSNEATVLYLRAQSANPNLGASPAAFGSSVVYLAQPLLSRFGANPDSLNTNLLPLASVVSSVPFNSNNSININATNLARPEPFVGSRSATNPGAPVTAAQWIYMTNSQGQTNARYAFWMEDESFKVNINVATNGARGASSLGTSPSEIRMDGAFAVSSNAAVRSINSATVTATRAQMPSGKFPTVATLPLAAGVTNAAELRFLTTANSAGLELSRGGFKRFNINTVTDGITGPTDVGNIRRNLDRIIAAITNTNAAPLFGQRFYRTNGVNVTNTVSNDGTNRTPTNHTLIYLNKIAANILDYIDADNQPTIVNNDASFSLRTGRPDFGIEPLGGGTDSTNSVVAVGLENVPRLQEYAIHARIVSLNPIGFHTNAPPANPSASYQVSIDHYLEFWNPSTNDIRLGGDAFLKIYDQPAYGTNGGVSGPLGGEGRPFEVSLLTNGQQVVFPAGKVTVLTTAPSGEVNTNLVKDTNSIVTLAVNNADRMFSGATTETNTQSPLFNGFNRLFSIALRARSSAFSDYQSAMLLGNSNGILDSFVGLPIPTPGGSYALHIRVTNNAILNSIGNIPNGDFFYVRGGSLRGNFGLGSVGLPRSTEGDPRTLNEQLEIRNYSGGSDADETRFYDSGSKTTNVPAQSTVGLPNTNYVDPRRWVDFSTSDSTPVGAPLVVANSAMSSVGEFGHLTDTARVAGTSGALSNVIYSRGGGRTLRIGQPEVPSWYDGNQTNASRTWTSWRLADIFTTTNVMSIPGLVNPNGALRDNGAAVRAIFHGMVMLPTTAGAPTTAGSSVVVDALVTNLISRLTNVSPALSGIPAGALNPLWERGELSEFSLLSTNTSLAGADMFQTLDRGREEVVRRSIQMITTRGSVFTVYVVGQAVQMSGTTPIVLSTVRLRTTFELTPMFANQSNATDDKFTPGNEASRFVSPTSYSVKVLNANYD